MSKNLLIVESPAKAKTIEKILGKDFMVKSCFGHIRDLAKEDMGIDINNNFNPTYVVSPDKIKVVNELRKLAANKEVWLASDEDREGEAISWHLAEVLGLDYKNTKRIVFHEITKNAIKHAVETPRSLDLNLVNAQQARRVLDRIVGFEISPILWRKMSSQKNLSAGRVQSVTVKLVTEREREINSFKIESHYKIEAYFDSKDINQQNVTFKAIGPEKIKSSEDALSFLKSSIGAIYTVSDVQVKATKRSPSAPFTTSTLQQEAGRKLGYSVSRTMRLAQTLYENGHITYMRTDSVNLSETALDSIAQSIKNMYGDKYHQLRKFKTKNQSAQEAHEAIRPTDMSQKSIVSSDAAKLYELIWKRTIASQMSEAIFEKTIAKITISTNNEILQANGEVMMFDGYLKAYMEGKDDDANDDDNDTTLPPLKVNQVLPLKNMKAIERFTRPPARYTEASLVKKLEELGIGRPSTYAPTISTIQAREYVEKKDKEGIKRSYNLYNLKTDATIQSEILTEQIGVEKNKLFPTDLGMIVTDFLSEHFDRIMDYSFTAKIEEEFDDIADGKLVWNEMIGSFYQVFHKKVENTLQTAGRVSGERLLGNEPETNKPVIARLGRYGAMVQIGESDTEGKPKFATLKADQSIETITLEDALELFKLPLSLGEYEGQEIIIGTGRFGPYVKWNEQFISIPKNEDPLQITTERAVEIIQQKLQADAPIGYYQNFPVSKGKGRFGPFLKWNDLFINVPRAYNFDNLSQSDIDEIVSKKIEKEANRYIQNWETEKIAIENGRWGPFIRFNKLMLKLGRNKNNEKYSEDELKALGLEEVKKMIEEQMPDAFATKAKKSKIKKEPLKKAASAAPKKTAVSKAKKK